MILRIKNISNGTLTINVFNRVLDQGESIEIESENIPMEIIDLESKRMIRFSKIIKPELRAEVKQENKQNKNKSKED